MKVTEITVSAKYSLDTGHGWKAIEVGATASLTASDETLEVAQQELYNRLSRQLKSLWANGNGKDSGQAEGSRPVGEGHQANTQPAQTSPTPPAPPREHWCSEHNQEWKPKEGKYGTFYSHKAPDGWRLPNPQTTVYNISGSWPGP
jgi:hypothetical protein